MQEGKTVVALARNTMLRQHEFDTPARDKTFSLFLGPGLFWLAMNRAVLELRAKKDALRIDLVSGVALVLQEDSKDLGATGKRAADQLSEDLADTPWLKG